MQIKRVQCPNCKVPLEVKNSKNEEIKLIKCPKCNTPLKVTFPPQQEPVEAKTFLVTPKRPTTDSGETQLAGAGGETVLGGGLSGATQLYMPTQKTTSTAKLTFEGNDYPLQDGQNIVGRQGTTSKATVQIESADRYMSRQHCSITVTTLPDGTKKAVLSNYQNKNLTTVDGQEIETGDEIRLTNGDRITMGHTTVVFKL